MDRKRHFFAIDLLRGISSLGILLSHYRFFYSLPYGSNFTHDLSTQPYYSVLWPVYQHGALFVQIFWVISGFVFAHGYAQTKIGLAEFTFRRFARLYPLHFLTLIIVAALQGASILVMGTTQIMGNYDLHHFITSLLFYTPGGGYDYSFNSPIWSVGVELLIYVIFQLVCSVIFSRGLALPLVLAVMFARLAFCTHQPDLYGLCGFYFFFGCGLYFLATRYDKFLLELVGLTSILSVIAYGLLIRIPGWASGSGYFFLPATFCSPIILLAAAIDLRYYARNFFSSIKWIGDSTYSIYLWHMPILILALIFLNRYQVDRSLFDKPIMLFIWVGLLLFIGIRSYKYFERPMQSAILKIGLKRVVKMAGNDD